MVNRYLNRKKIRKGAPKSFPKFEMDESIGKFCNSLAAFCNHIQCSCDALKQSVDRRPIPLGCFLSLFVSLTTTTISVMPEFCSFLFCVGVDFGVPGGQILLRRLSCNAWIGKFHRRAVTSIYWNPWPWIRCRSRSFWVTALKSTTRIKLTFLCCRIILFPPRPTSHQVQPF